MNLEQALDVLKSDPQIRDNITYWKRLPEKEAEYDAFPTCLDDRLKAVLEQRGIHRLYTHQASAIKALDKGKNIVVVTPTASGKTLCYNLPVINSILNEPDGRALYLFPTKALSQDQMSELHEMVSASGADIKTYTFDGDTPATARKAIRSAGHIVITNPDMLHQGILPNHTKWIKLFENVRYIVVDELHFYRGVFGSHVANVIRRLKRICAFYGSSPQFICCSATISNPRELAEKVIETDFELVDNNGAPRGEKHFILYNPPVVNHELGIRKSVVKETYRLAQKFLAADVQTIVFARSRLRVEILLTYLKEIMVRLKKPAKLIRGYRGGYLPTERRAIERGLRSGEILGVVSTNALELGIDIGQLGVCLMAGYPGTITSSWQQAGRSGRRSDISVAVLLASSAPLDQFIINHPEYFFEQSAEAGIVDPNNLIVLMSHIKCAAFELPFEDNEKFGVDATHEILSYLEEHGVVHHSGERWHWTSEIYPAEAVSLRSASPENFVIIDKTGIERVIGEIDYFSAPMLIHEEAIYIHESRQYHVDVLDWDRRKAYVHEVDVDHYTDAQTKTSLKVLDLFESDDVKSGAIAHGEVAVTTLTTMYKKIKFHTHENIGAGIVNLPELEMHTTSYWWEFDNTFVQSINISKDDFGNALSSLANVLGNIVPLYVMSDPTDIRSIPMIRATFSGRPTIYIYDTYPGGVGFSKRIFRLHDELLIASRKLILDCACKTGCPSCVGPLLEVGEDGKQHALKILDLTIQKDKS
ncbi:MAG: DEAD/DEAH box helicase [candidate division KSB1 bacterium]|jgi:DEAD/DEAH box helicase domain-containing protein|nr:DEAD/DEAH box helicase [candidate division KSB1 bacterium]